MRAIVSDSCSYSCAHALRAIHTTLIKHTQRLGFDSAHARCAIILHPPGWGKQFLRTKVSLEKKYKKVTKKLQKKYKIVTAFFAPSMSFLCETFKKVTKSLQNSYKIVTKKLQKSYKKSTSNYFHRFRRSSFFVFRFGMAAFCIRPFFPRSSATGVYAFSHISKA